MNKRIFAAYYTILLLVAFAIGITPWVILVFLSHSIIPQQVRSSATYGGYHPLCTLTTRIDRYYFGDDE